MMPPRIGSQLVSRETGRSRHHAIVFSIPAPYCSSFPSPFVSVRCGANPLHVVSWHCQAIAIPPSSCPFLSVPVVACPFRLTSRRGPSHISYPSRFSALQHAAFPFHLAALPVLPVVPYLRIWVARSVLFGDLLPLEAALATVAPLEQTAQCAVVQPLAHGLRVLGVHHEDAELKHGTGWDGLGCGQRNALTGGGAGAKRALAATALGTLGELERDSALLHEHGAIDNLLEGRQLARTGTGHAAQGRAGVL